MNASMNIEPKAVGISKLWWAIKIMLPRPLLPVKNSPTTAPITDRGTAILKAAKRYGRQLGILSRKKISFLEALTERKNSKEFGFTERNPVSVFTRTGKNVISAAIDIFGPNPKPNQITRSGAIATIGVTLTINASGNKVFSKNLECAINVADMIAIIDPIASPVNASSRVIVMCHAKKSISWSNLSKTIWGLGTM